MFGIAHLLCTNDHAVLQNNFAKQKLSSIGQFQLPVTNCAVFYFFIADKPDWMQHFSDKQKSKCYMQQIYYLNAKNGVYFESVLL